MLIKFSQHPKMNETEYDDFFGINNIVNEVNVCKYCGKAISLMPFVVNDMTFCDVVCCKLYGDENQWKSYSYNKQVYDLYYKNQLLAPTAIIAYQILRKVDIPLLPHFYEERNDSKELRKNKYLTTILTYITQTY